MNRRYCTTVLYLPADQGEDHYRHLILADTTWDEQDVLYHCTYLQTRENPTIGISSL